MRLIFMGTPDFSVPALRALAGRHDLAAVYSQPPRPAGRGQKERPSPVQVEAERLGIPVRVPKSLRSPETQAEFAALNADVAVVVAYGLILPQAVLDAAAHGCLNIHASLLPRWRGAAPIHRAILAGDAETGVTIMRMEAGLDTGPVLLSEMTRIGAEDTAGDLHDRLSEMGARLIVDAVDRMGSLSPVAQQADGVTYAAKIDKAEARVDWSGPADAVDRLIRGLSPFPGAWCMAGDQRLKLLRSRVVAGAGAGEPGRVLRGLTIACGSEAVEVTLAQREGRRPMAADDLLRGAEFPDRLN
jgi:methionyl-tRNA formyltransferase